MIAFGFALILGGNVKLLPERGAIRKSPCFAAPDNQRSRSDKCGSCCVVLNLWQTACTFPADGGACAHAFPLPDTPSHTKVTFRKTENQVIESRKTWFIAEHFEQISRGCVPCNVRKWKCVRAGTQQHTVQDATQVIRPTHVTRHTTR